MRPLIQRATLTGFSGLARSVGLDPAALLTEVGLDPADLDSGDDWIPAAPVARLLEAAARRSGCEDFGLRLAALRRLGTLGPIAVALRDEPDLRGAVHLLLAYERIYDQAVHLRLRADGGTAVVDVWLELGEPAPHAQLLDLAMGAVLGIVRALRGATWAPGSASFARSAPGDPTPWRRFFGAPVTFAAPASGLAFPAAELAAPVVTSDPSLRPYSRQFLRTVAAAPAETTAARVAEAVEALLPRGRCDAKQVGRAVGLGPRALQQHLAAEGTTFSAVVHATRGRLAERYVATDRYSLTEVSRLLGFAAPSAFTRWFHQRFGVTPTDWRRAARAHPGPAVRPGTVRSG
ncbi:AraC family transcriptional regulator [Geodermatophilus sp. SYSU D00815]